MLLEFKSSSRKMFFWVQEAKDDKDEENITKINQYINSPPTGQEASTGLSGLDQNAMLQMFGGATRPASTSAPATTPSASATPPTGGQARPSVAVNDLQSILTGMGMPASTISSMLQQQQRQARGTAPTSATSATTASSGSAAPTRPPPSLSQMMNSDSLLPLLSNPAIQAQLLPYLPEERRTPEELRELLRSPQFHQSLESFSSALQSGQLGEMTRAFGIPTGSGPTSVESFLNALQAMTPPGSTASTPSTSTGEQKDEKKDQKKDEKKDEKKDDDHMDTK